MNKPPTFVTGDSKLASIDPAFWADLVELGCLLRFVVGRQSRLNRWGVIQILSTDFR